MHIGLGELAALASALLWAVTSVVVRPLAGSLSVTVINAGRSTVAAVLLLALLPLAGDPARVPLAIYVLLLGSVIVGLGLGDSIYFESLRLLGVARAAPMTNVYPVFTTILALLVLAEPLTTMMLVGIALVVVGVYLAAQRGALLSPLDLARGPAARGSALVVLAAFLWALSAIMMRPALEHVDIYLASVLRMPATAALMWLLVWQRQSLPSPRSLGRQVLVGLVLAGVLSAAGMFTFITALQAAGAAKTATLTSTSPLYAVLFSALVLREPVTGRIVVGALLSVGGIWLLLSG